ncbi:MAG TPA: phosphoribosylglycinamide formyltransferase [Burkholderiales bacterium]|jgi:phosphoribosylglycinamide formyltransferase-1|nr:phosphoribosylglycinamide formyltransferase [Burkholderiales bacterium]
MSVVVLISGRGSNLEALLRARIPVSAVVSNVGGAGGLAIAARQGIPTMVVKHGDFPTREAFEEVLIREIDRFAPRLVVHAGFMRITTALYVDHYAGRAMNIHPSLLPSFTGLHTHERALAAGVKIHGCTVHFVTAELDAGPVVLQAAVPVLAEDTVESLAARVLRQEHKVYPQAVQWFLDGKLSIRDGRVHVKGNDAQLLYSDTP